MTYSLYQSYFIFKVVSNSLTEEICSKVFGQNLAKHMWDKWLFYDRNVINFISALDTSNRKKLFDWFENIVGGDAKLSERY